MVLVLVPGECSPTLWKRARFFSALRPLGVRLIGVLGAWRASTSTGWVSTLSRQADVAGPVWAISLHLLSELTQGARKHRKLNISRLLICCWMYAARPFPAAVLAMLAGQLGLQGCCTWPAWPGSWANKVASTWSVITQSAPEVEVELHVAHGQWQESLHASHTTHAESSCRPGDLSNSFRNISNWKAFPHS